jgi:hypothetical protein
MKVKIQTRQVYHKFAEVEIEVCEDDFEHFKLDNGKWTTLQDYLICKEELFMELVYTILMVTRMLKQILSGDTSVMNYTMGDICS